MHFSTGLTLLFALSAAAQHPCGGTFTRGHQRFQKECATQYLGYALQVADSPGYFNCTKQCNDYNSVTYVPACVAVSFNHASSSGNCVLHAAVDTANIASDPDWTSVRMLSPARKKYSNTCLDGTTQFGDLYTAPDGTPFQVLCGQDYFGNNIQCFTPQDTSQHGCYGACTTTDQCNNALFINTNQRNFDCCLKYAHNTADYNHNAQPFQVDNAVILDQFRPSNT